MDIRVGFPAGCKCHTATRNISTSLSVFRHEWPIFFLVGFFVTMVNGQKKERYSSAQSALYFEQSLGRNEWGVGPKLVTCLRTRLSPRGMRGWEREPRRTAFGSVSLKEERSFCVLYFFVVVVVQMDYSFPDTGEAFARSAPLWESEVLVHGGRGCRRKRRCSVRVLSAAPRASAPWEVPEWASIFQSCPPAHILETAVKWKCSGCRKRVYTISVPRPTSRQEEQGSCISTYSFLN